MPQNIISLLANFIETSLRRRFFLRSGRMFSDHSFRGCFVGNKAVGRISKRRQKENKARQIFPKKNIFYLLISTRTYFACFVFAYDSNRCQKFYRLALISAFKTSTECIFYLHYDGYFTFEEFNYSDLMDETKWACNTSKPAVDY